MLHQEPEDNQEESQNHWSELWSRLHLSILQTILAFPTVPGAPQLELITLADMLQNVHDVSALVQLVSSRTSSPEGAAQLSVDRLVQILQVALATGAFRCSLGKLASILLFSYLVAIYSRGGVVSSDLVTMWC